MRHGPKQGRLLAPGQTLVNDAGLIRPRSSGDLAPHWRNHLVVQYDAQGAVTQRDRLPGIAPRLKPIPDVLVPVICANEEDTQVGLELRNDPECGEMICGAQPRHAGIDYFD